MVHTKCKYCKCLNPIEKNQMTIAGNWKIKRKHVQSNI